MATTIENWLDQETFDYYKALTILSEWDEFKEQNNG